MSDFSAEVVAVDPAQARAWLGSNVRNRNIRQAVVDQFSRAMAAGAWDLNGEAIKIADTGTLLDGQHRLLAVIKADQAVSMLVVTGMDERAQETMDTGSKRRVSDVLTIRGEHNATVLAAAARSLVIYSRAGTFGTLDFKPSAQEVLQMFDRHPGLRDASRVASRGKDGAIPMQASVFVPLRYLFGMVDEVDADAYFRHLHVGAGLDEDDPIFALRRNLLRAAREPQRTPSVITAAWAIKAWNAWRAGNRIKLLSWKAGGAMRESFPEIDGLRGDWDDQDA